jgi:hypothetical protein
MYEPIAMSYLTCKLIMHPNIYVFPMTGIWVYIVLNQDPYPSMVIARIDL